MLRGMRLIARPRIPAQIKRLVIMLRSGEHERDEPYQTLL